MQMQRITNLLYGWAFAKLITYGAAWTLEPRAADRKATQQTRHCMPQNQIYFFDTTLRDGEQSP
ncbi:MAG TPA: hypothetical protein VHE33_20660, partial [Acidobacteriaceae bacterium]|nr:hypothetical protein [Acidobacteriaceae bacterium]